MGFTVVVTAPSLATEGLGLLHQRGCRVLFVDTADTARLTRLLAREPVDAIISRTMSITRDMMESCPTLRVISKHGVGTSNIDTDAATDLGIAVFSTPGANARAVAEFTLSLILAGLRHVARFDRAVRAGTWARLGDGLGFEGRRLGLVGYGRIARQVGQMTKALGFTVMTHDPFVDQADPRSEGVESVDTLDALLAFSDVLSLHCPARLGAPPLLDAARLARLPQGALLVNTARGELVDEAALVAALDGGRLCAAALDTFAAEPLAPDSPLRRLENVILTPHVAGSTPDALARMAHGAAENILGYLDALAGSRGGRVRDRIPCAVRECALNLEALSALPGALRKSTSFEETGA